MACRHRRERISAGALLAAAMLLPLGAPASAQRLFGFGDSLLDTGRVCDKVGFPSGEYGTCSDGRGTLQWLPDYAPYPFDRATNQAEGGAGTGLFNLATLVLPGARGTSTQVAEFLAAGGSFGADDLVIHSAGPNNRYLIGPLGPLFGPLYDPNLTPAGLATRSLAETQANVAALVQAGARNLIVYGGRPRDVPATTPDQVYFAGMAAGIADTLAPLATEGTRIRILDFQSVYLRAIPEPEAYGLATPFLYEDGTHPTEEGHRLLAQYVARLAATADGIPAQLDAARAAGDAFSDALLEPPGAIEAPEAGRWRAFIRPLGVESGRDDWQGEGGSTLGQDLKLAGVIAGVGLRAAPGLELGLALGTASTEVDIDQDWGETRADSRTLQGWMRLQRGALQADVALGWIGHSLDNRRRGVIDTLESDPDGDAWQASARLAWLQPWCGLQTGPLLNLRYSDTRIDDYTETGDDILAQRVDEQSRDAFDVGVGWRVQADRRHGAWHVVSRLDLSVNTDALADSHGVRTAAVFAPTLVAESRIDDDERDDPWLALGAGLRLERAGGLALHLGAGLRHDEGGDPRYTAILGLEQAF